MTTRPRNSVLPAFLPDRRARHRIVQRGLDAEIRRTGCDLNISSKCRNRNCPGPDRSRNGGVAAEGVNVDFIHSIGRTVRPRARGVINRQSGSRNRPICLLQVVPDAKGVPNRLPGASRVSIQKSFTPWLIAAGPILVVLVPAPKSTSNSTGGETEIPRPERARSPRRRRRARRPIQECFCVRT